MLNLEKDFTSLLNPVYYGNQVETSLSGCHHACTHLGILIAGEMEQKEDLKNLLMWGELILLSFHGRLQKFHIREK